MYTTHLTNIQFDLLVEIKARVYVGSNLFRSSFNLTNTIHGKTKP